MGHTALRPEGVWLAAQWACGDDAVLSHLAAAAYHGMIDWVEGTWVDVSTLRKATSRDGISVHRVRYLDRRDIFEKGLFRVTTIPRTLIDLADVLRWDEFRAAADRVHKLHTSRIREAQSRAPGRKGAPLVGRLLEADEAHTKSEFERKYLRFCRTSSLARPDHQNVRLAGHLADCIYESAKLVVELDGRAYHQRRSQMRADRNRDTDYQLAGHRILRLVWDDLHPTQVARTAERVRKMLALGAK